MIVRIVFALAAAYFIGAIPFGYLIAKLTTGRDIRDFGSGNIGATNVFRMCGARIGILVLLLDAAKGVAAVLIPRGLGVEAAWSGWPVIAGLVAVCGHNWTVFLRFRGGKGVATSAGMFAALAPGAFGLAILAFAVVLAVTRYVALGSMLAAGVLWAVLLVQRLRPGGAEPSWTLLAVATLAAAFIVIRHRTNIRRLLDGTEHRIHFGGGE